MKSIFRLLVSGLVLGRALVHPVSAGQPAPVLPEVSPEKLAPLAALEGPAGKKEVSGIVGSRQWPGTFWVQNDSGDEPRIYPVTREGKLRVSAREADAPGILIGGVVNSDWEDIATDASGNIIIADVGNNSNARRDLVLHYVREPEPTAGYTTVLRSIFVQYPDQKAWPAPKEDFNYDCEAVFTKGDTVYFLTKHRSDTLTRLYRLDDPKTGVVNTLTLLGSFDVHGEVTAADASPDGSRLLVLTYDAVWMFEAATAKGDDWLEGQVWWLPYSGAPDSEAVCFDGADSILIAAEEGDGHLYSLPVSKLRKIR